MQSSTPYYSIHPLLDARWRPHQSNLPLPRSSPFCPAPSGSVRPGKTGMTLDHNKTSQIGSVSGSVATDRRSSSPASGNPRHSCCIYAHRYALTIVGGHANGTYPGRPEPRAKAGQSQDLLWSGTTPSACLFCRIQPAPVCRRPRVATRRTPRPRP